jgi:putative ATP-binding cassette transporter
VSFFSLLPRRGWITAAAAVAAGLVGGACSAGLIALINTALHRADLARTLLAAAFAGLVAAKIASNIVARLLLNRFAQQTLSYLCRDLSRRVLATPLAQLESLGIPRILVTLTDDIATLGWAAQNVPALALNAAMLVGCAIYLGWLSWRILLAVVLAGVVGALCHRTLVGRAFRYLAEARNARERLFRQFRALTEGLKELKLHGPRREAFLVEEIAPATEMLSRSTLTGVKHHLVADTWSQMLFYGLLGGLLFLGPPAQSPGAERITGYILVTLYMMGPVWAVLESWPIFSRAQISVQKVRDLGLALGPGEAPLAEAAGTERNDWQRLSLDGVTFAYPADVDGHAFVLGPLDVTFERGELVFLVGGNGSGKSTLMKVLTGLYRPQAGSIRLDGKPLGRGEQEWYCGQFSAVFSDFYLFDRLLGLDRPGLDAQAHHYLVELELEDKLRIADGVLSTTALSQGQRRRLALLAAFLEDRAVYVFDEWAADQDPHYREIFYKQLLPRLRARGKTVLVISHDDRYYGLGDRVVKFEYGKLVQDWRPVPAGAPSRATVDL